jgi:hypothetical protein
VRALDYVVAAPDHFFEGGLPHPLPIARIEQCPKILDPATVPCDQIWNRHQEQWEKNCQEKRFAHDGAKMKSEDLEQSEHFPMLSDHHDSPHYSSIPEFQPDDLFGNFFLVGRIAKQKLEVAFLSTSFDFVFGRPIPRKATAALKLPANVPVGLQGHP